MLLGVTWLHGAVPNSLDFQGPSASLQQSCKICPNCSRTPPPPYFRYFPSHYRVLWEEGEGSLQCLETLSLGFVIAVSFDVSVMFSVPFRAAIAVTSLRLAVRCPLRLVEDLGTGRQCFAR